MKRNKTSSKPPERETPVSQAWEPKEEPPKKTRYIFDPNVCAMMILGLYPIAENPRLCSFSSLYSAATFTAYVVLDIFSVQMSFKGSGPETKYRIAMYIRYIISFLNNSAILCWILNGSRIQSLWKTLLTDGDLDAEGVRRPRGSKLIAVLNPLVLVSVYLANYVSRAIYWEMTVGKLSVLPLMVNSLQLLLLTTRCWHHMAVLVMLKQRFQRLNSYLSNVAEIAMKVSKERRKRGSVAPLETEMFGGKEQDRVVADCRRVHGNLVRHCRALSAAVGLSFLFDTCSLFMFVTTSIYYVIDVFQRRRDVDMLIGILSRAVYVLLKIVPIFTVMMGCDSASDEGNGTRTVVSNAISYQLDPKTLEQLRLFTVQLLQWKVEFSAYGVLVLDSTTIFGMIANILTYLVIIVQFASSVDVFPKNPSDTDLKNETTTEYPLIEFSTTKM